MNDLLEKYFTEEEFNDVEHQVIQSLKLLTVLPN